VCYSEPNIVMLYVILKKKRRRIVLRWSFYHFRSSESARQPWN